ncbi:MAG: hypothetical protein CMJ47_02855 [Planctomyces sp.]|nr:hypothetical protein [Planctomyces sp.]
MDELQFESELKIEARAGKSGRVSIVAYSGGIMSVNGFGAVVIDLKGLRMPASVPLLLDHNEAISAAVGSGKPEVFNGRLHITGQLATETDGGKHLLALNASGMNLQASVGVRPEKVEYLRGGETAVVNGKQVKAPQNGLKVVRSGDLYEVSVVVLGADSTTSVAITAAQKGATMAEEIQIGAEVGHDDILKAERARFSEIEQICAGGFGEYGSHMAKMKAQCIAGDITVDALRSEALRCIRAARPTAPTGTWHSREDSGALSAKHIEAALLATHGHAELAGKSFGDQVMTDIKARRLTNLPAIMRASLELEGRNVPDSDSGLIRASWSTQLLVTALENSLNKTLDQFYRDVPATWKSFCRQKTARDFHEHKSIRPSMLGSMLPLASDGEIKHGTLDEAVFTYRVDTFGRMISISRQDIKNDHLDVFEQVVPMMGNMAMRNRSDNIWKTILDAGTHFSSGNGNLGTTGSALSLTSLDAGITAMRTQRDAEGNDLDISPAVLVVPPELETTAKQILESIEVNGTTGPSGNALKGAVKLEVESRISNTTKFANASTTQWYLFGNPNTNPVTVATLDETTSPVVETKDADFNKLGIQMRVFQDYGSAMGDFRAAYKATGAGGGE